MIPVIIHLIFAPLYYSQVQAQSSDSVEQTSLFLIPDAFFSPTLTGGTGPTITGQVSVTAGTSFSHGTVTA